MKKFIIPIALAALMLTGCAPEAQTTPMPTVSKTATPNPGAPSPEPKSTDLIDTHALEVAYVEVTREQLGDKLIVATDDELVSLAWTVCRTLSAGVSPAEIQSTMMQSGWSQEVSKTLIVGPTVMLCNENASKVVGGW